MRQTEITEEDILEERPLAVLAQKPVQSLLPELPIGRFASAQSVGDKVFGALNGHTESIKSAIIQVRLNRFGESAPDRRGQRGAVNYFASVVEDELRCRQANPLVWIPAVAATMTLSLHGRQKCARTNSAN